MDALKGEGKMIVEKNIDWLSFNADKIPGYLSLSPHIKPSPMRNYRKMYTCDDTGTRVMFGNPRTEKYHIVMSASAIARLPMATSDLVALELEHGSQFSRVDLAVTQSIDEDGLLTVVDVVEAYREGKIASPLAARGAQALVKYRPIADVMAEKPEPSVETFYVGAWKDRAKRGIFRAYDKGAELNLEQFLITRFEIETKRELAQSTAKALAAGDSVASVFRSRFDIDDERWRSILDAEPSALGTGKHDGSKQQQTEDAIRRWKWLVEQVAPALGRALAVDIVVSNTTGNYDLFNEAVLRAFRSELASRGVDIDSLEIEQS